MPNVRWLSLRTPGAWERQLILWAVVVPDELLRRIQYRGDGADQHGRAMRNGSVPVTPACDTQNRGENRRADEAENGSSCQRGPALPCEHQANGRRRQRRCHW